MARTDGRINLNRIAEEAEKQKLIDAWKEMTYEQQQAYLKELEEEQQESNRMSGIEKENEKSANDAFLKAQLGIEFLKLNNIPVNPTTLSQHAGISRSYIYKNKKIKRLIDKCKSYNDELKRLEIEAKKQGFYSSPTTSKDDSMLNYHLHVKLIESYVHEYQTLKALNKFMEEKIASVKQQIEEKNNQ